MATASNQTDGDGGSPVFHHRESLGDMIDSSQHSSPDEADHSPVKLEDENDDTSGAPNSPAAEAEAEAEANESSQPAAALPPSSPTPPSLLHQILSNPNQISAMLSNYSTSYNVVSIGLALPILQSSFLPYAKDVTEDTDSMCASALLGGMVLGQLVGGAMADSVGRIPALYGAIVLQIVGSLASALMFDWTLSVPVVEEGMDIFDYVAAWRFVLGIGAGAVYPIAAVLSAESEDENDDHGDDDAMNEHEREARKVQLVAITFSTQGVGFVAVPALTYPLSLILGEDRLDVVWRMILGIGALPGFLLVLIRWCGSRRKRSRGELVPSAPPPDEADAWDSSMHSDGVAEDAHLSLGEASKRENEVPLMDDSDHEDSRSGDNDEDHVQRRPSFVDGVHDTRAQQQQDEHRGIIDSIKSEPNLLRKLCGTAGTWFLFDILFYGNTLFQPIVLETAFGKHSSSNENPEDEFSLLVETARDSLFLSLIALPGYFVSIAMLGRTTCCGMIVQTPRYVQMQGFALMAILYAIVGAFWTNLTSLQVLLVLLYGSTFFFANYGPNATTFLLPSITYSHDCRSTLNGISAAAGKAGALLGATVFEPAADALGDGSVMLICSGISVVALLLSWGCVIVRIEHEGTERGNTRNEENWVEEGEEMNGDKKSLQIENEEGIV